jgi:Predicted membrane protein
MNFIIDIFQNNYIRIIFSSVTVYFFIIVAIRLFGKKELAQLSVYDLVFILLISNAVQNAMVGPDSTLLGGLVAAASLFVVNYILKKMQIRFPKFGKAIQGEAIMLVFQGKILSSNMKSAGITEDELMEVIREHSVASLSEVDLAVLEVDGNISVLSTDLHKKTIRRRKAHKIISKQQ